MFQTDQIICVFARVFLPVGLAIFLPTSNIIFPDCDGNDCLLVLHLHEPSDGKASLGFPCEVEAGLLKDSLFQARSLLSVLYTHVIIFSDCFRDLLAT